MGEAPWLAGGGRGVAAHQVTPSTHVCCLSDLIGGMICRTLRSSDSLPLMRPRAASKLVQALDGEEPSPTWGDVSKGRQMCSCFALQCGGGELQKDMPSCSSSPLGQLLLRPLQVKTGTSNIYSFFHVCRWFTADGFWQVQEKVSSVHACKNLQSSWGNMMDAHRTEVSM